VSRVQLAINVSDIDQAVEFYERLFKTPVAKRRPGYANFAIADPPLKLVLIQGEGQPATLNHLGIEVESSDDVAAAISEFQALDMATSVEENTTCCFALQDKVWVNDPDGAPWEVYTVLADAEVMHPADSQCCTPAGDIVASSPAACC
jgi:catechol 2,3-dioxygenase-like lactoylglutathione lyase family enzyme